MKDKLIKLNKKKIPGIEVIDRLGLQSQFYDWLIKFDPFSHKVFSLKRLIKMFLAENSHFYSMYEKACSDLQENIRIAKVGTDGDYYLQQPGDD